ncbi:WSC domain-containing protein [Aureococcus anophagefferens]|nr:WSC domain-containing protein [Aureococcus anophagefferens]
MHSVFVALLVGAAAAAPRCYVDRVDARQLPHVVCEAGTGDCAALTVRYCAAQCRALDYEVAGVEAGHACSCGHALANASAAAPLAECDDPCVGNATEARRRVSAYGSVVARPDGSRVFAVWIQNVHNVSHLPGAAPSTSFRADMLGAFVWKYSDDEGATWSEDHYEIPVPYGYIESVNSFSKSKNGTGDVQIMWQVDHVKVLDDGTALFAFTKIGTYAVAAPEEIFVLASRNLLSEDDPTKVTWEMWPDDDHGIGRRIGAVGAYDSPSRVTEEPHVLPFDGDAKLALFWRTDQGYMGHARTTTSKFSSLDAWTNSSYAVYEDTWASGSEAWVKQPRGPLSPKKQPNGLWLMTYYNTEPLGAFAAAATVSDRNNMWLTVGREAGGTIKWSQPELALYDRVHSKFHGYPDVVTDGGKVYITEAYKGAPGSEVKTHEVAPALLEGLYGQNAAKTVATAGVVWESSAPAPLPAGRAAELHELHVRPLRFYD